MQLTKIMPVLGLLAGASVWGLIWYPYRALEHAGISGELAATVTYAGALALGAVLFRRELGRGRMSWLLAGIGLSAGWANIGFTIAVVYGDVMRVVMLFYMAPLWTVLFARLLLGEQLVAAGYCLMAFACAGAIVMLWQPRMGWPLPRSAAEWLGMSAGLAFALSNVLARRADAIGIPLKVLAVFAGGGIIGSICLLFSKPDIAALTPSLASVMLLLLLAVVLLSVNVAVQHSLVQLSASRAIVIYLFELVVTAVSAWLLAGEVLTAQEWCGGAMIVAAGLLSGRIATVPRVKSAA